MHQLLSEDEYLKAQDEYGADSFTAKIGAEAIRDMLKALDLEKLAGRPARRDRASRLRDQAEEARQAPEADRGVHRSPATSRNG